MSKYSYDINGIYSSKITEHITNTDNYVYSPYNNTDTVIYNIGQNLNTNMQTCINECNNNQKCKAFVTINSQTDKNHMDCYYKDTINNRKEDSRFTTYQKNPNIKATDVVQKTATEYANNDNYNTFNKTTYANSSDYTKRSNTDIQTCKKECNDDPQCKGFITNSQANKNNMDCFYKKTISNHKNDPKYTLYEKK